MLPDITLTGQRVTHCRACRPSRSPPSTSLNRTPSRDEHEDVRIPLVDGVADTPDTPSRRVRAPRTPAGAAVPIRPTNRSSGASSRATSAALGELYDRWARPAFSLARRVCADEGLAEDVVQEVFIAFWREPGRFDPSRGAFGSWLLTLVHHKAVDAVRRESAIRRRTVPAAEDGEEWSAIPGSRRGPGRAGRCRRRPGARCAGSTARRAARGPRPRLLRRLHPARGRNVDGRAARHRQVPDVHRSAATTQRARPTPR